jgi:hypothetical protein
MTTDRDNPRKPCLRKQPVVNRGKKRYQCATCGFRCSFDRLDGPRMPPHRDARTTFACPGAYTAPIRSAAYLKEMVLILDPPRSSTDAESQANPGR